MDIIYFCIFFKLISLGLQMAKFDFYSFCLYVMSIRNKKSIRLQTVAQSLQNSLQKIRLQRGALFSQKKYGFLGKKIENSPNKIFNVRKLSQNNRSTIQANQQKINYESLRMKTQKVSSHSIKLNESTVKRRMLSFQRSQTIQLKQKSSVQRFPFLTQFQREEINSFQVFYIGPRRIHSIKDFTNSNCEARYNAGDGICYRYQIISGIGQGSFGQVFKAFDHKKRQLIALKIIRNEEKFNRQAKVQIKILQTVMNHGSKAKINIVELKHSFFFRGHACLCFELLHSNLYQFLKKFKFRGLKLDLIRRMAIQLLQGLLFFKKMNIIHCDLKPQNILLKHQQKTGIKIIDVGSGCFQNQQIYTYIQSRFYRAPQIILGMRYTPAIDIWSLGCVICQLFLGYPIFPGESQPEQLQMFMEVIGIPSRELLDIGTRSSKFYENGHPILKANSKGKIRQPNSKPLKQIFKQSQDSQFIQFISRFLVWNPQDRITPRQALLQPWIMKGLPDQIKKQHIASLKTQPSVFK